MTSFQEFVTTVWARIWKSHVEDVFEECNFGQTACLFHGCEKEMFKAI